MYRNDIVMAYIVCTAPLVMIIIIMQIYKAPKPGHPVLRHCKKITLKVSRKTIKCQNIALKYYQRYSVTELAIEK